MAAQLKLCLGRWEGVQSVTPPLMVVPLPRMKPERGRGGSNPLHPGYASASADVAGHKRMAKGFLRHSESAVSGKDGEMGEREKRTDCQPDICFVSRTTQNGECDAMQGRGRGREGVCRSVHHHRHLWLHPSHRPRPPRIVHCRCLSLSNRTARPLASLMEFAESTA